MSTFCLAKELSIPILYVYKGQIITENLMAYQTYNKLWNKIAEQHTERSCFAIPFGRSLKLKLIQSYICSPGNLWIMVGFTWERVGDTSTSCYKRIVHIQFGGSRKSYLPPALVSIIFASNCGYWCVFTRCPWFPFTYSQFLQKMINKRLSQSMACGLLYSSITEMKTTKLLHKVTGTRQEMLLSQYIYFFVRGSLIS